MPSNMDNVLEIDLENLTPRQLLNMVIAHEELIVTVDKDDIPGLKRSLTVVKSRDNAKLKASGLEIDEEQLRFSEIPLYLQDKTEDPIICKLHIALGARKKFTIHKVEIPDDSI